MMQYFRRAIEYKIAKNISHIDNIVTRRQIRGRISSIQVRRLAEPLRSGGMFKVIDRKIEW